jgi:hypothetical protein
MLMYSPLSAYFDDVIPQQPALSNDGTQRQPAFGDFTSPIIAGPYWQVASMLLLLLSIHSKPEGKTRNEAASQPASQTINP